MPYATLSDIQQRYGAEELRNLTDIGTPRTGAVVEAVLDRALEDASAWIDSFLMGRYPLPIVDAAALSSLKLHCVGEARYLLMTAHPDDAASKAHDERAAFFRSVAKGDISLIAPIDVPPAAGAGSVVFAEGAKVFGRDSEGGADGDFSRSRCL